MSRGERKSGSRLQAYRAKRSAERTPEPFGREALERPRLFVVQQHAARSLHYDLRLELGGVLLSWAVPKGPSLDPSEKRLAVATEEHPLEYGDFEGVIPEGNYGAGAMILWDRGRWLALEDPEQGIEKGKLLFELYGYKLRGVWTLVRTKRSDKEWLLIKKPDEWAATEEVLERDRSVLSGLTVEELALGGQRGEKIVGELAKLDLPRRRLQPGRIKLMLAELRQRPFSRPGWIFELKYDGFRVLALSDPGAGGPGRPGAGSLFYRSGQEATALFPELVLALSSLPYGYLMLDGEIVVLDAQARPSFQRLQRRAHLTRPRDVDRAAIELPATLYAFDLLGFRDFDLRSLPLLQRKELLRRLLPPEGPLRYADHVEERGADLHREVQRLRLEGVVAKKAKAPYRGGRSASWLKIRADRTGDFVVVGFTTPAGSRPGFGALHLAVHEGTKLSYVGRVGTGFSHRLLKELRQRLEASRRSEAAVDEPRPDGPEHVWVEPELVAEVRFSEYTESGQLRHPVFLRLRDDKRPAECVREEILPPVPEPQADSSPDAGGRRLRLVRLNKVFWPDEGYTKGDLLDYYRSVAPSILPYLEDRPVVLVRYPDGIEGKSFFQKNAPGFTPDWLRTETIWSEDSGREIDYFVCDDEESLLYLVNMGTVPLHVWSSRIASLQYPDWSILDLDPKEAPFENVVRVARAIRDLCQEIELPSFVKTSGGSGLHVVLPLARQCTYQQSRQLAELIARVVVTRLPEIATTQRSLKAREGRVYIDYVQNGHGRLLVAPLSVRPFAGAPVSTPLRWREVTSRLDPRRFTLRSVPARLRRMKGDPLRSVLTTRADLASVLGLLTHLL